MISAALMSAVICATVIGFPPAAMLLAVAFLLPVLAPLVIATAAVVGYVTKKGATSTLGWLTGMSVVVASPFALSPVREPAIPPFVLIPVLVLVSAVAGLLIWIALRRTLRARYEPSGMSVSAAWVLALAYYGVLIWRMLSTQARHVPFIS